MEQCLTVWRLVIAACAVVDDKLQQRGPQRYRPAVLVGVDVHHPHGIADPPHLVVPPLPAIDAAMQVRLLPGCAVEDGDAAPARIQTLPRQDDITGQLSLQTPTSIAIRSQDYRRHDFIIMPVVLTCAASISCGPRLFGCCRHGRLSCSLQSANRLGQRSSPNLLVGAALRTLPVFAAMSIPAQKGLLLALLA